MIELPFWARSPSIFTCIFWLGLALYGCSKLKPKTWREWIDSFSSSAFVVGLTILPFDILWTVHQALTFGHLFPNDLAELLPLFNVKIVVLFLCLYESRKMFENKGYLIKEHLFLFAFYIPFLLIWFQLAPNPSWTDWTFAWRFGYGTQQTILAFLVSHVGAKFLQGILYYSLWKDQE